MIVSPDRILTTHVGSLPRSALVTDLVYGEEKGLPFDADGYHAAIGAAVDEVVGKQVAAGIDIVSDGEMSKLSYATYIRHRLTGFEGDSPRRVPADLTDFPRFRDRASSGGGTPTYRRPCCVGHVTVRDMTPLTRDLEHFAAAIDAHRPAGGGFMNSASPGVIALFQPDNHYGDHATYLRAVGAAMRAEYQAIVAAGLTVQIDSPDLALGRHMLFADADEETFLRTAHLHVDVLNEALEGIPPERVRVHVCWGNYAGPHHRDIPLARILPVLLRLNAGILSFEASNPRHAHEWTVFRDTKLPDDKALMPGCLDSTTNFIEHPELVAERIARFAEQVGKERVLAGTDCGFATFAGFGTVDPDIVYAKLQALAEGAGIASRRLWGGRS